MSFHDYLWQDVLNVSMKQGMLSTEVIAIKVINHYGDEVMKVFGV